MVSLIPFARRAAEIASFATVLLAGPLTAGIVDHFEGGTLNPMWVLSGPGTATLSTAQAHGGSQSLLMQTSSVYPFWIQADLDLGSNQFGTASVWLLSQFTAAGYNAGMIVNAGGSWALLQDSSWPGNGLFYYRFSNGTVVPFSGTPGTWHHLEIETTPAGTVFRFDGNVQYSGPPVISPRTVGLSVWGGGGGTVYFDDFSFSTEAVPEPSSLLLFAAGLAALKVRSLARRH